MPQHINWLNLSGIINRDSETAGIEPTSDSYG